MSTIKLYYDNLGRIKDYVRPPIFATSKKVDKIEVYTDFDSQNYEVSIAFKRPDGILLGAYPMKPSIAEDNSIYHFYDLDSEETRIPGALQITVRFESWVLDDVTNEMILETSRPISMTEVYIHETIQDGKDKLSQLVSQLNQIKAEIKELQLGFNEVDCEIIVSDVEPVGRKAWIDTSEDAMVEPSVMGLDAPGYEPTPLSEGPTMEEPEGEPVPMVQGHQM